MEKETVDNKLGSLERWLLDRNHLGLYGSCVGGANYRIPSTLPPASLHSIIKLALVNLLESSQHPLLSCAIRGTTEAEPWWFHIPGPIDIEKLVQFVEFDGDVYGVNGGDGEAPTELESLISRLDQVQYDTDSSDSLLWSVTVVSYVGDLSRVTILFTYHHVLGDGISSSIFHDALLASLHSATTAPTSPSPSNFFANPPHTESLPQPIEKLAQIAPPISFILPTVLSEWVFPAWLSRWLGLKNDFWTGKKCDLSLKQDTYPFPETLVRLHHLTPPQYAALKQFTKHHNVSPTSLICALQTFALWTAIPETRATRMKVNVPISLRQHALSPTCISGSYTSAVRHEFVPLPPSAFNILPSSLPTNTETSPVLEMAQQLTARLGQDVRQEGRFWLGALSLLGVGVVPQKYTAFKHNTKMDALIRSQVSVAGSATSITSSTEISNLGLWNPAQTSSWSVESALFSTSTSPLASVVDVRVVATPEGGMMLCWGFEKGRVEESEVDGVRRVFRKAVESLFVGVY